jgi:hypothetical protein
MAKRDVNSTEVIKKGEASRILGFGNTAGYRYLTFLEEENIITPIKLPGIKTLRYRKEEILELANNRDPQKYAGVSDFKTNN